MRWTRYGFHFVGLVGLALALVIDNNWNESIKQTDGGQTETKRTFPAWLQFDSRLMQHADADAEISLLIDKDVEGWRCCCISQKEPQTKFTHQSISATRTKSTFTCSSGRTSLLSIHN
mmetsp:Transcript_2829/g.4889  ORF Transcript_2829/g.4889 Transcript_2829/m.4889 type:complete len:118 (+) Transcript_2829:921-1274(+)